MTVYNLAFLGILIYNILLLISAYGVIDLRAFGVEFFNLLLVLMFFWWMIDHVGFLLLAGNRGRGGIWAVPFLHFLIFTFLFIGLFLECEPFSAIFGFVVVLGIGFVLNVLTMFLMARDMKSPPCCGEKGAEKAGT